jgi:NAD-dependent SIR2 family protein deacetylase
MGGDMLRFKSLFRFLVFCFGLFTVLFASLAVASAAEKPEIFAQKGHSGKLRYLSLSPKEDLLLSIADWKIETDMESAVKLWDVKSKRILKDIKVKE